MHARAASRFLTVATALAVIGCTASLFFGKNELHAAINRWHSGVSDLLFPWLTYLADGWVPTILALALLIRDRRSFFMVSCSAGFSAIVVQTLKHFAFADVDRPIASAMAMPGLHLVPGIEMLHHNSFPSGHSTCAFSMCFALAVIVNRTGWSVFFALLAGLMAFSRVYLSQHYVQDITAGLVLGTITAWFVYRWLYRPPMSERLWMDRSPFRRQNQ